jgi:hypothetical protein
MSKESTEFFNVYSFLVYIFKSVTEQTAIRFLVKSFRNHSKDIHDGNRYHDKFSHLETLFGEHKDDITFVHDYIQRQIKLFQENMKNDQEQTKKVNIILRRLRDKYRVFIPYVRPPSKNL